MHFFLIRNFLDLEIQLYFVLIHSFYSILCLLSIYLSIRSFFHTQSFVCSFVHSCSLFSTIFHFSLPHFYIAILAYPLSLLSFTLASLCFYYPFLYAIGKYSLYFVVHTENAIFISKDGKKCTLSFAFYWCCYDFEYAVQFILHIAQCYIFATIRLWYNIKIILSDVVTWCAQLAVLKPANTVALISLLIILFCIKRKEYVYFIEFQWTEWNKCQSQWNFSVNDSSEFYSTLYGSKKRPNHENCRRKRFLISYFLHFLSLPNWRIVVRWG